jgi:hypothetical protein
MDEIILGGSEHFVAMVGGDVKGLFLVIRTTLCY